MIYYALRPKGYLFLGSSETIGGYSDLFSIVDKKYKIYMKRSGAGSLQDKTASAADFLYERPHREHRAAEPETGTRNEAELQREADRLTINRYAPAGVIINEQMDVIQFRGDTTPYLRMPQGRASFNLLKIVREELLQELRSVITQAKRQRTPARRENIVFKSGTDARSVAIEGIPLFALQAPGNMLILFEQNGPTRRKRGDGRALAPNRQTPQMGKQAEELKQELIAAREYLQSVIEEQEATNEELKSANEEILSSNEELQSTNEELETAKEELQSSNEELTTVNEEVQNRNLELAQLNSDLTNLLNTVNLPIVMVTSDLRIRRFTPMAERLMNLLPTDIGAP